VLTLIMVALALIDCNSDFNEFS